MTMLANLFGYVLNFFYNLFNNYGIALIIFSIFLRIILLPITIKQQKSMAKNTIIQEKKKEIKFKYKSDPEKMNKEIMGLYKQEKVSSFSGCLSSILQIIIILAVFYVVRSPLTFMKKIDSNVIEKYTNEILEENNGQKSAYSEIEIIQKRGNDNQDVDINMNFLGIDLSKVPTQNLEDIRTYIIPILYIVSSFISIRLSMNINNKDKKSIIEVNNNDEDKKELIKVDNKDDKKDISEEEAMQQMSKNMSFMMPLMSITIAVIAPLGLALYWLVSNILMIIERLFINKFLKEDNK
ncbi:MAG: membrane protein insertase YidC [Clostridia bacterium]|nr:membrane protein insertase YidC [Clostridia bacterium]